MEWKGKAAVITGASSGIGEATAELLACKGLRVTLVARRLDRLTEIRRRIEVSGGSALILEADLSLDADRQAVFDAIQADGGADVLINNAGFGWYGYFSAMPWETALEMLRVNIGAAVHLTSLFLPEMLKRLRAHIINVGSISGGIPSQGIAMYGATKSFLDAFTTALYRETRYTRTRISIVRAGPVLTEFAETALGREGGGHVPTERVGVSAAHVAQKIWWLLQHPCRVLYVPWWLGLTPIAEGAFGWLIDLIGPALLRRTQARV